MSEYYPHEHDFVERTQENLQSRISYLAESRAYVLNSTRRGQIEREMSMIAFEMAERLREAKNEEVEQAWNERD